MKHQKHAGLGKSEISFPRAAAIFLLALACFCPNPALPIGSNTGLQIAQVMALLALPTILLSGLPTRQTLVSLLLLLPVLLSGFLTVMLERVPSVEVALKTQIATALVLVLLVPVGKVVNKGYTLTLLFGAAWAIVLNAAVGFYQAYCFTRDKFPLAGLYTNPSFNNFMDNDPERYALYVKRPFGLFPEPSAMAASIGPWLVLIVGLLLYPRLRQGMTRGGLIQLILAVVCGVGLILISSSGFTIWLLPVLLLVTLPYVKGRVQRLHRPESLFLLFMLVLVGVALVVFSVSHVGSRVDIQENSSWSARLGSIVWSFTYLGTNLGNLIYGVGPGQSYLILQSSSLHAASFGGQSVSAVWSVIVNYILENGLFGALALTAVLIMVVRAIVRSSARLVGATCLGAWLAGVVLTTSYMPLLPVWLFLGILLGWDRIFLPRANVNSVDPRPKVSPVRKGVKT